MIILILDQQVKMILTSYKPMIKLCNQEDGKSHTLTLSRVIRRTHCKQFSKVKITKTHYLKNLNKESHMRCSDVNQRRNWNRVEI